MNGEFEKQIKRMEIGKEHSEKILNMINSAGEEFPCLTCPSKDECGSFKWYLKWFGDTTAK